MNNEQFKKWIIQWNNRYPLDRWWRQKHGVGFNSKQHSEMTPLDIYFEYQEDLLFKDFSNESKSKYIPGLGLVLNEQESLLNLDDINCLEDLGF